VLFVLFAEVEPIAEYAGSSVTKSALTAIILKVPSLGVSIPSIAVSTYDLTALEVGMFVLSAMEVATSLPVSEFALLNTATCPDVPEPVTLLVMLGVISTSNELVPSLTVNLLLPPVNVTPVLSLSVPIALLLALTTINFVANLPFAQSTKVVRPALSRNCIYYIIFKRGRFLSLLLYLIKREFLQDRLQEYHQS